MLLVKEVCCVGGVESHGAETLVWTQSSASPFPDAAKLTLASERTTVGSYGNRVPVEETGVGVAEIGEERGGGGS
jgi:hypothetical protein